MLIVQNHFLYHLIVHIFIWQDRSCKRVETSEIRMAFNNYQPVIIIMAGVVLLFIFGDLFQETTSKLIFLYFFAALAFRIDSRLPVISGLLLLIAAAVEIENNAVLSNQIAIYSYYFLVIGVVIQLIEKIREKKILSSG